jgi:hypothetical protein
LVEPAFQEVQLSERVATQSGQVTLKNNTNEDQRFEILAADIQQFDADGKIILADKPITGDNYTLSDFIQLPSSQSAVKAGETVTIPFIIRNGPDLQPGGHYSALVIRSALRSDGQDQQVLPAITSFLLVHKVGGERYHLSLLPIDLAQQTFVFSLPKELQLTFSNQGNTHVRPYGLVIVKDIFGNQVRKGIINEGSVVVLPETQRTIPVKLTGSLQLWPVMLYSMTTKGHSVPGDVLYEQDASFFVINLLTSTMLIGGLSLILGAILIRRKRRK